MSTKMKLALASLLLLASTGIAAARPRGAGGPGGPGGPGGIDRAELILKADKNKDGRLDDAERTALRDAVKAARQAHRAQMIAKYDANKDGKLDDTERAKVRAERMDERFRRIDSNGDGVISKAEFQAAHAGKRGHGKHGKRGGAF